ncbi:Phosphoseryl tRNA kinase [Carabus blaptoides fortunei]
MVNICLVVLIGLPGAGKSHFCKYFLEHYATSSDIVVTHVSFDQIEHETDRRDYKPFRTDIQERVVTLLENKMKDNAESKWIVLIDDNMYYRSMRRSYYNVAKRYRIGYCQVHVICNINIAKERNNLRIENKVPLEVIEEIDGKLEPPGENNWEKYSCELYSHNEYCERDLTNIWHTIQLAMQNPVQAEVQLPMIEHTPSVIHEIDLVLRKIIGEKLKMLIQTGNKKRVESLSKELMCKKKYILSGLRNGDILVEYKDSVELENILCSLLQK